MVEIRILHTPAELETIVDLELAVWGLNPRDAVPSALMHVIALHGGVVLGAYDADRLVGLLLAFPARSTDTAEWLLWSHMTGIHPAYQSRGIGAALKRFQRQWALDNGYTRIGWTFDPLQRGNARFNFALLGADAALTAQVYHVNFYGEMDDAINRGLPSDRLEVRWHLAQPSVHPADRGFAPFILSATDDQLPELHMPTTWEDRFYRVSLPVNVEGLRRAAPDKVLTWRLAVRDALQAAFAHGCQIVDFMDDTYVLQRFER
ncbi:MAG: GNAT family N-acetyltransferase [bacterium]|nr:GNAT family N-acetyltransferase [bacterium]